MTRIVEYVGAEGVLSSRWDYSRAEKPRPGDIIQWSGGEIGRIWTVGDGLVDENEVHVCYSLGSAFLGIIVPNDKGLWAGRPYVDISGGPFRVLSIDNLTPTHELHVSMFWNWGDNRAGADMGVQYHLARPVFAVDQERPSS